jgi:hypothetical protein
MSSKEIAARLGAILSSGRDPAAKLDDVKRLADELEMPKPSNFVFSHAPNAKLEGADVPKATPTGYPERPKMKAKTKSTNARVKPATTKYRRSIHG